MVAANWTVGLAIRIIDDTYILFLIQSANPQSRIIVFANVVRPSVPTFQNLAKQNKMKTMFALARLWIWPSG